MGTKGMKMVLSKSTLVLCRRCKMEQSARRALSSVPILISELKWNVEKKRGENMVLFRGLIHFPLDNNFVSLERVVISHHSISHL
jgi:hypothetical protein